MVTAADGARPQAPPRPTNPPDGPPKEGASFQDPVKLDRAARILETALARNGLTIADLCAPGVEHARAA